MTKGFLDPDPETGEVFYVRCPMCGGVMTVRAAARGHDCPRPTEPRRTPFVGLSTVGIATDKPRAFRRKDSR